MLMAMPAATAADSPATPLPLMTGVAMGWEVALPAAGAFVPGFVTCTGVARMRNASHYF